MLCCLHQLYCCCQLYSSCLWAKTVMLKENFKNCNRSLDMLHEESNERILDFITHVVAIKRITYTQNKRKWVQIITHVTFIELNMIRIIFLSHYYFIISAILTADQAEFQQFMKDHKNFLQLLKWDSISDNEVLKEISIIFINKNSNSDCFVLSSDYRNIKINSSDILKLAYNSTVIQYNNWLADLRIDFDKDSARFSTSCQKIILISITLNKQLKIMFNSIVRDTSVLSHHWWKFKNWLQDVMLHENSDKLKLSKEFITAHQFLKKDSNQFYFRFFNLEIQFRHAISTEDYHTRFLKLFQNLMNQHDHKYLTIQNAVIHIDKLWQTLNREKIHLELKKEKKKAQQHYENFDQCHHDNLWSQDQSKEWWDSQQDSQQNFQQDSWD